MTTAFRLRGLKRDFDPRSVAGLQAWYDFADAATLFTDAGTTPVASDGDAIYQANDKSGNTRNAVQASSGARPLYKVNIQNGHSCARFAGTDDCLDVSDADVFSPLVNDLSVFLVSTTSTGWFVGKTATAYEWAVRALATDSAYVTWTTGGSVHASATKTTSASPRITSAVHDYLVKQQTFDRGSPGTAKTTFTGVMSNTTSHVRLGDRGDGTGFVTGDIFEVLVYNTALSVADHNLIGAYLAAKWGLSWTTVT